LTTYIGFGIWVYNRNEKLSDERSRTTSEITNLKIDKEKLNTQIRSFQKEKEKTDKFIEAISQFIFQTGSDIAYNSPSSFDKHYIMWLRAYLPLTITKVKIKSKKAGKTTITLCDEQDVELKSKEIEVNGKIQTVSLNFDIPQKGNYYLKIKDGTDSGYTSDYDFTNNNGFLRILGCCANNADKLNKQTDKSYYQYFYNIEYRMKFTAGHLELVDF